MLSSETFHEFGPQVARIMFFALIILFGSANLIGVITGAERNEPVVVTTPQTCNGISVPE